MEKFLWCQPNDTLFPIPTHRIRDTCYLISYKIPIPMIILSYEPKEALKDMNDFKNHLFDLNMIRGWII